MTTERTYLITSESVSMGHPDKMADQISDAVLDAMLKEDPGARVACETMVTTGMAVIAGEVTCKGYVDIPKVVRDTVRRIGYTDSAMGFDADSCAVLVSLDKQSSDIAQGVTEGEGLHVEQGAGDQGIMFGFACRDTENLMPLPIELSHRLVERQAEVRRSEAIPHLRPDAKSQVTVRYHGNTPEAIDTIVLSTQHGPEWNDQQDQLHEAVLDHIIKPVLGDWWHDDVTVHVNPTGKFEVGGPLGDCGLTGRKIIVDTYGGRGRHGGGAFSGKDPTKVDRSGAYMARYIAKNIVAAELAEICEVQLSYAIGVPEPTSIHVDCQGTAKVDESALASAIAEVFDLTPKGIITTLDLLRPIYTTTAVHGHFGRQADACGPGTFTWERTDRTADLKTAVERAAASV